MANWWNRILKSAIEIQHEYPRIDQHIIKFITYISTQGGPFQLSTNEPDKNLINTVEQLEEAPVNSHEAQQQQQARNDRRKQSQHDSNGKFSENETGNYH